MVGQGPRQAMPIPWVGSLEIVSYRYSTMSAYQRGLVNGQQAVVCPRHVLHEPLHSWRGRVRDGGAPEYDATARTGQPRENVGRRRE